MRLWNLTTKEELFCFEGHSDNITELILFKNNTKALTTSDDGMLIIWNLLTGKLITSLSFGRQISKASLTLDEKTIIIGEQNGQLHFIKILDDSFNNFKIDHKTQI